VSNKDADDHFTYIRWDEATLPAVSVVTPSAPGEKVETPEDLLRRAVKVTTWTPSLTLLYFHTPHEELEKSKLVGAAGQTMRQCKTFHDEQVARWLSLYHPVEVDMGKSDAKAAERLGCKDGAIFAVVDQDLNVLATSKVIETSEGVKSFLEKTLKSEACKSFWAPYAKQMEEQKAELAAARALAKQEKWKEASEKYASILATPIFRVSGDLYDVAVKESAKAARKAAEQK
jgi:hypothetical protein